MMRYYYPGAGYGMMSGYGIFSFLGGVVSFLFWLVIILLIIRLIRRKKLLGDRPMWMHRAPLDILKERYAKGEIDKAEFEDKKKDLTA